jgi:hypothetical protein
MKQTKPAQAMELRSLSPVFCGLEECAMRAAGRQAVLATMLLVMLTVGCRTWSECTIVVRSGSTAVQREQLAKAYVTEESLVSLRSRLKQRFPAITEAQLQALYLKWSITEGGDETIVSVIVGIKGQSPQNADLLKAACDLVEADINGLSQQRAGAPESRYESPLRPTPAVGT